MNKHANKTFAKTIGLSDLIRGQGKLLVATAEFCKSGRQWQADSQVLAASAAFHAHATGDVRPLNGMIAAMPKGTKVNALRDYFTAFAPVKWNETAKKFKFEGSKQVELVTAEGTAHDLLPQLLNKAWWEMAKAEDAKSYKPFDLKAKLLQLVAKGNKVLEEGDKTKEVLTKVEIAALEALVVRMYPEAKSA